MCTDDEAINHLEREIDGNLDMDLLVHVKD